MKRSFYLVLSFIFFISCHTKKGDDRAAIRENYFRKVKAVAALDTAEMSLWKPRFAQAQYLFSMALDSPGTYSSVNNSLPPGLQAEPANEKEHPGLLEIDALLSQNPALAKGDKNILDTANKYVLSFLSAYAGDQLLTVLNLDEDNHALVANMDFPNMEILYCNYDLVAPGPLTTSLALRPFEARVLKIR